MKVSVNPTGIAINQYLMKIALPLGGYFILEYLIRNYSATNIFLGLLNIPMMCITVVLVYFIVKKLRDSLLEGKIAGFFAWTFGVQLMFFAGLIEAAFVYIFNEFIVPGNLVNVHNQLIGQYENVLATIEQMPEKSAMVSSMTPMLQEMIDLAKEAPVSNAIETAITMLSNNIFYGMIIMMFVAPIIKKK